MASKNHLGMEITDNSIKYLELKKNREAFEIGHFGELSLPFGFLEEGSIRDGAGLKKIISSIRAKGKWKEVTVSHLPDQVYLADLLKEAGFKDIYFESAGEAVARAAISAIGAETDMIVYFAGNKMDIYAGLRSTMKLLATFNLSSDLLGQMRDKEIIYSFIKEKINEQYISWHTHPFDSAPADAKALAGKQGGQSKRPKIKKIILSGDMPNQKELTGYLQKSLQIKVEAGNVWQNLFSFENYIPAINFRDALRYSAAIGLALRPFEK